MSRRKFLTATVAVGALVAMAGGVDAQTMKAPKGPVEIATGSGPGGTPDVIFRNAIKIMTEQKIIDIPVVVQNRTGGAHANAYNHVLGKRGDENLLLVLASPVFTTPIMQGTPSVIEQTVPIAGFIQSELVFMVQPNSPFRTMKDFVEAAKKEPRRLRIAGAQAGGTDHLATAQIEKAAGIRLTYVPYDSGSAALASFLGGNVEATFGTLEEGLPVFQGGKARPLGILSAQRRPEASYANVPTMKEQGYDIVFGQFWGVAAPPGTDPAIAAWWADKFKKVVETKVWQDGLKEKFQRSDFYALADAGAYFRKEQATFRALMEDVGLAKK